MRTFRLFAQDARWWSFADYGAVLDVMERLCPQTVLEFGPGSSTLALVEGGAMRIDSCEDDDHWMAHNRKLLAPHLAVELFAYQWRDPLAIAAIDDRRYDLALIDGPHDTSKRPAVIDYCLQRCAAVLVPLELGDEFDLRPCVWALAEKHACVLETRETGMLAGAFALLTKP